MSTTVRNIERQLFVPLTTEERATEVVNLLDSLKARQDAEDETDTLKERIKFIKSNIDIHNESISTSAFKIKNGQKIGVPCKMELNWDDALVTTMRLDTFEIIDERNMNSDDKPQVTDELKVLV